MAHVQLKGDWHQPDYHTNKEPRWHLGRGLFTFPTSPQKHLGLFPTSILSFAFKGVDKAELPRFLNSFLLFMLGSEPLLLLSGLFLMSKLSQFGV